MLEVERTRQCGRTAAAGIVAETATKSSLALLLKHSIGGCNSNMLPSNCRRREHIVLPRDTSLLLVFLLSGALPAG